MGTLMLPRSTSPRLPFFNGPSRYGQDGSSLLAGVRLPLRLHYVYRDDHEKPSSDGAAMSLYVQTGEKSGMRTLRLMS